MRLTWRLVIAALLLAHSGCTAKPGVKELKQSRDAVRAATGWEADVTMTDGAQQRSVLVDKVECPSRRDQMWTSDPPAQLLDPDGRVVFHNIWFDGSWYTSDRQTWHTFKDVEKKLPNKPEIGCGQGPSMVSGGTLSSVLDDGIAKGEIHPGPKMTENGYDCTWWDISAAPGQPPQYTVCINEPSHLPQVIRSHENGHEYTYTLSQWNTASVGLPPELAQ